MDSAATLMARLKLAVMLAFCWVNMILFGALAFETLVFYPNHFYDVPRSLQVSTEFMAMAGPGTFLRPAGQLAVALGLAAVIAAWRVRRARYCAMASLLVLMLGNMIFSILFFWPRNTIMFTEGLTVHSAEYLRTVATEFWTWNWLRCASDLVAATLAFASFLAFYRHRVAGGAEHARLPEATAQAR